MPDWRVTAGVFSLDVGGLSNFESCGVRFRMAPDAEERYRQSHQQNLHRATGEAEVTGIAAPSAEEAIKGAASDLSRAFAPALILAHGHDVIFSGYQAFRSTADTEEAHETSSAQVYYPVRSGSRRGWGSLLIIMRRLPEFLDVVVPKLRDREFTSRTGLDLALMWYNEPVFSDSMLLELDFIVYWLTLETMANASAVTRGTTTVLDRTSFGDVRSRLVKALDSSVRNHTALTALKQGLGTLNYTTVGTRVSSLLLDCGLPPYVAEVRRFIKWRNTLLHGSHTSEREFHQDYRRIRRLVEKILLSQLGVYGQSYLHPALMKEDLLAR